MRWLSVALVACTPTADAAPRDLATCTLATKAFELGDGASTAPSTPVRAGDGFVVAYTRFLGKSYELVTQRVSLHGPEPVVAHGTRPGPWVPLMAGRGDDRVLVAGDKTASVLRLDATGAQLGVDALAAWPDAIALGPRGVAATSHDRDQRTIARPNTAAVTVPALPSWPIPGEELIASGDRADVALVHTKTGVSVVAPSTTYELVHVTGSPAWSEVSIAAGHDGFLVARTGPQVDRLELYRLDADGKRDGEPAAITAKTVTRMPRVAALGTGWLVTYWDGIGTTLVRVDGAGREIGKRLALRSGDERGGQTDARIAVGHDAIAVTWLVGPPAFSHGSPDEIPKKPGPRLAILTCSP